MHDCTYSAVHTPPGLYMSNRNRKMAKNEKARGSPIGSPINKIIIQHGKVALVFGCGDMSELGEAGASR